MYTVDINGFEATQQTNGTFIYKAKVNAVPLKRNGEYKDKPQFKVIEEIEQSMKEGASKMINDNCTDILKYLTKIS